MGKRYGKLTHHEVKTNRSSLAVFDLFHAERCGDVVISGVITHTPTHVDHLKQTTSRDRFADAVAYG